MNNGQLNYSASVYGELDGVTYELSASLEEFPGATLAPGLAVKLCATIDGVTWQRVLLSQILADKSLDQHQRAFGIIARMLLKEGHTLLSAATHVLYTVKWTDVNPFEQHPK